MESSKNSISQQGNEYFYLKQLHDFNKRVANNISSKDGKDYWYLIQPHAYEKVKQAIFLSGLYNTKFLPYNFNVNQEIILDGLYSTSRLNFNQKSSVTVNSDGVYFSKSNVTIIRDSITIPVELNGNFYPQSNQNLFSDNPRVSIHTDAEYSSDSRYNPKDSINIRISLNGSYEIEILPVSDNLTLEALIFYDQNLYKVFTDTTWPYKISWSPAHGKEKHLTYMYFGL
jgi:hypothetical protein